MIQKEDNVETETEEEEREPNMLRGPARVSEKERDDHEATHIPFREWCPHCVRGRAMNLIHKKRAGRAEEDEELKVPREKWNTSS